MVKPKHFPYPARRQRATTLRLGVCALLVHIGAVTAVHAAAPARTMYMEALAQEQAVRGALAAANPSPALVGDVRAVIASFEKVTRQYPASGYSDNALWQAGILALDSF